MFNQHPTWSPVMALFIGESVYLSPDVTPAQRARLPNQLQLLAEQGILAPPFLLPDGTEGTMVASEYLDLIEREIGRVEDGLLAIAAEIGHNGGHPATAHHGSGDVVGSLEALWVIHIWTKDLELGAQLMSTFDEVATRARRVDARFQIAAASLDLIQSITLDAARYDVRMAA
jgi:hypothetical protein